MPSLSSAQSPSSSLSKRAGALPWPFVFLLLLALVALTHATLLHLPYFWDEGGYYVPAALDFYHSGTLIPTFTNAHPPLPNVVLGSLWHVFGVHILVTRLTACCMAALALTAVFCLGRRLLGPVYGFVVCLLTAAYPIWFAQSSLAHADIFAAAFTLAALALYLPSLSSIGTTGENFSPLFPQIAVALLSVGAVLSKETAVVQPAALLTFELALAIRARHTPLRRRDHLRWCAAFAVCIPVLAAWYAYHFSKTGHIFGNPEYLRYNATANFTPAHVFYALRIRCLHLFWQREMWVPLTLAAACLLLLPRRRTLPTSAALSRPTLVAIGLVLCANLVAFAILGGALLTRYLLPAYPLLLLVCLAVWREHTASWPWLAAITGAAFTVAIWQNPNTFFAPEDNLTYRDMIVVQQDAIHYLEAHYPQATVLTAWPVAADLFRPELGYTARPFHVFSIENFTLPELTKAAQSPGRFDTAVVFTTHYTTPQFRQFLLAHPGSWRGRRYRAELDLTPQQIAAVLGGHVVWQEDHNGEWAAVLRFPRSYMAGGSPSAPSPRNAFRYTQASPACP